MSFAALVASTWRIRAISDELCSIEPQSPAVIVAMTTDHSLCRLIWISVPGQSISASSGWAKRASATCFMAFSTIEDRRSGEAAVVDREQRARESYQAADPSFAADSMPSCDQPRIGHFDRVDRAVQQSGMAIACH